MMPVIGFDELNILIFMAFLYGLILGAARWVGDVFRLMLPYGKKGWQRMLGCHFPLFITDMATAVFAAALMVVLFSCYGGSAARIDVVPAMLLGFALFRMVFGRYLPKVSNTVKKLQKRVLHFIYLSTLYHVVAFLRKRYDIALKRKKQQRWEHYNREMKKRLCEFFGDIN